MEMEWEIGCVCEGGTHITYKGNEEVTTFFVSFADFLRFPRNFKIAAGEYWFLICFYDLHGEEGKSHGKFVSF